MCVQNPEIYQDMAFNFTGKVHPGLVVEAEIKRKKVIEMVSFQVRNRRETTCGEQNGLSRERFRS
jgi:hypothetical protein